MARVQIRKFRKTFLMFFLSTSFAWAEQWGYEFEIRDGKRFSLCRDYVANLQQYITENPDITPYDLSCKRPVSNQFNTLFRQPKWEKVALDSYDKWFYLITKVHFQIKQISFDEESLKEYVEKVYKDDKSMERVIWMSRFDFDFNGKKEHILRVDRGGDCSAPSISERNRRYIYIGNNSDYFALTEDKEQIKSYGYKIGKKSVRWSRNSEYFFYVGRTYEAIWRGFFENTFSRIPGDIYTEKSGDPKNASIYIQEPYPRSFLFSRRNFSENQGVYRKQVCNIFINFSKMNTGVNHD